MKIHPAVFHLKAPDGTLQHKSVVVVSDETYHKVQTVYAFMKALMGWVKGNLPQIETLHYLSDSPTSQYRNSTIFGLMAHHKTSFNIKATSSYFESGHGKGPYDGIGGAVKRSADTAIKKGQLIKDAKQFFEWGSEQESTSALSFLYVDIDMVAAANTELEAMGKFSVPRTIKLHSIIPSDGVLHSHETSCFALCCWSDNKFHPTCEGWTTHNREPPQQEDQLQQDQEDQQKPEDGEGDVHVEYAIGDYVAAKYNEDMYVGRVANIDDEEYEINFMESIPQLSFHYRWPTKRDLLWVHHICVLCKLSEPLPIGRSQRAFTLVPHDQNILSNLS